VIVLPARWVLGIYIVLDNLLPFFAGSQSGVAYGAHIGGFFAGLGIAWAGEQFAWRWPWSDSFWRLGKPSGKRTVPTEPADEVSRMSEIQAALTEHDPERAIDALARMDRHQLAQLGPNECVLLANWLDESGHPIAATKLLRNCLSNQAGTPNLADVYLTLGLMRLKHGQPTAAYQHLLSVFDYHPSPETAERARQALAQIDIYRRK
jgi:hypothetical protein